jgi:hypothetical protein
MLNICMIGTGYVGLGVVETVGLRDYIIKLMNPIAGPSVIFAM